MKRILSLLLALTLLLTPALAAGGGTGAAVYLNRATLAPGFTYDNAISYTAAGRRVETYTMETAPGSSVHPIVLACDTIYGGMTVSEAISYARGLGYNVVGAVNGDFFYTDTKVPTGMVVENGVYKSSPEGCNAVAFGNGTAAVSEAPKVDITITKDGDGGTAQLTHFNKTRTEKGGLYLYSQHFSTVSTRTTTDGWAVRMKVTEGAMSVSGTVKAQVTDVYEGKDASKIGEGYLVLTAATASELHSVYESFAVGDTVTITTKCSDERLAAAGWVTGCGNILVSDGQVYRSEWWDSAVSAANPRTAVGVKADGTVVLQVMDGRTSASRGATLAELAADLISQGCVTAVNMDGGGSSVMDVLLPGSNYCTMVNSPSDGSPRRVASYLMLVTDSPSTGVAAGLHLKQDGAIVLTGSSLRLDYLATDSALKTAAVPAGLGVSAQLGTVTNGVYTAGQATGTDTVTLSAAGVTGSGTIHVISRADAISVTNASTGKAVSSVTLEQGETLSLTAAVKYLLRSVAMDAAAVSYAVTGDIGTVTPEGVFTASGTPGAEGKLTVSAAGLTYDVQVKVAFEFSDMKGHWAEEYVRKLYQAGVVNGATPTTFAPEGSMKRGDFMEMLYRAVGKPAVTGESPFTDVKADLYYAAAINWAAQSGIAKGDGDGAFRPEGTLTRQEGFAFVHRALAALGVKYTEGDLALLEQFTDKASLADWAAQSAATLVGMGVLQGNGGALSPTGELTRAQMAKILCTVLYRTA
jgi:hypothetical protein